MRIARLTSADWALLAVVFIWGSNFIVMKLVFEEIDPLAFNVVRLSWAALVLLAFLLSREGWQPLPHKDGLKLLGIGLLGNTLYQIPFSLGLKLTTPGNSSLLLATIPVWSAILVVILRWEQVTRRIWTGIFLSFLGVLFVSAASPSSDGFTLNRGLLGDLLTLGAAACWAGYTVFSKDLLRRYSPLRVSTLALIAGVAGLWIVSWPAVATTSWGDAPAWIWGAAFYSGAFPIALAYVIWAAAIRRVGAARTAIYNNLVPVVTFVIAYFALQQPITPLQLLGAAVVLVGVWLTVRP